MLQVKHNHDETKQNIAGDMHILVYEVTQKKGARKEFSYQNRIYITSLVPTNIHVHQGRQTTIPTFENTEGGGYNNEGVFVIPADWPTKQINGLSWGIRTNKTQRKLAGDEGIVAQSDVRSKVTQYRHVRDMCALVACCRVHRGEVKSDRVQG